MSTPSSPTLTEELVDPAPVRALAALFDDGLPVPSDGDPLPPLWHWAALARWASSSQTGSDGHPHRDGFLPPGILPRRMFAGGEIRYHGDCIIGSTVRRESRVASITEKQGRSGLLQLVAVEHRILNENGRLLLEERQDLIYRAAAEPSKLPVSPPGSEQAPTGRPLEQIGPWQARFTTDPTSLMRFSAATANAHRIHYDWPYATGVEGYGGLVVHGPLMTMALAQLPRLEAPNLRIDRLVHRNRHPLLCGQPARAAREPASEPHGDDTMRLALMIDTSGKQTDDALDPTVLVTLDLETLHAERETRR